MERKRPVRRGWSFWIDRGGTFTDVVAVAPDGQLIVEKLLSEDPERYRDAALEAIRRILTAFSPDSVPSIATVKMGTTIATNALLERRGEPTVLAITAGFGDALKIGWQTRPALFACKIDLPAPVYSAVVEVKERVDAQGAVIRPLDESKLRADLAAAFTDGYRALAIVLLHGWRFQAHETRVAAIAREIGFTQISVSHEVTPLIKLIGRGDTTVADAYLSPVLRRYVDQLAPALDPNALLLFMQSNGGLAEARAFRGKDAILSGPAGGVVGMAAAGEAAGFHALIGFDMGGTSTDVSHYAGAFERAHENVVAGIRIRAPMLQIHTVAAGGGSICSFDGARLRVGPRSAGADPGPACYRRGGPLTVTDCNVILGKVQPAHFPHVFGPDGDLPLDASASVARLEAVADDIERARGQRPAPAALAEDFIAIAVEIMASAIKRISVERGYDIGRYSLVCFGGAGGQHACLVADALGLKRILIHPLAGVLSAYGVGFASLRVVREETLNADVSDAEWPGVMARAAALEATARTALTGQGVALRSVAVTHSIHCKYAGSDTALVLPLAAQAGKARTEFEALHQQRFGFLSHQSPLRIEALSVEAVGMPAGEAAQARMVPVGGEGPAPLGQIDLRAAGRAWQAPLLDRERLPPGTTVTGPALLREATATTVIEPGWRAHIDAQANLILERTAPLMARRATDTKADPALLELFNHRFMAVAEQMGAALQSTAFSVNIKERLDYSCAVFDAAGGLVANAPHIPVHLGSMSDSVRAVIAARGPRGFARGDAYMLNAPDEGGTHLPDITVVAPVFLAGENKPAFFTAARGHHADVGGLTPGSMPPHSHTIEEEGVLIKDVRLVADGHLREAAVRALFASGSYPARNPDQNLADLKAQLAACAKGAEELKRMAAQFGRAVVSAYMAHVQDNAEENVRRVIAHLSDGAFVNHMDNGARIEVQIRVDRARRTATIDFTGTSPQRDDNFNAPLAITRAAVLYVFRTLVDDAIPLNEGCLKPLTLIVPVGSMLRPRAGAAVAAGNVETSQAVVDALYGALGVLAAAQGTMNNFTFGDDTLQYYETLCGGAGAGPQFDGASAVHTHMTNSRLTDPEILETRFPVRIERFGLRAGSGGAGRFHGGDGVIREIRFQKAMTAGLLSNRRLTAPFGLKGGGAGASGRNRVLRADGRTEELGPVAEIAVEAGDRIVIETPGGGGYGRKE